MMNDFIEPAIEAETQNYDELANILNAMDLNETEAPVFAGDVIPNPQSNWEHKLATTEKGTIKRTASNVALILHHDEMLKGLFKYNEVDDRVYLTRDIDYFKAGANLQTLPTYISVYISGKYQLEVGEQTVYAGIQNDAYKNRYNPLKDYYRQAYKDWDGTSRLETVFIDYLGAEDNEINRKMTRIFFEGLVQKVKNPFIKFDRVLDLVGEQGVGKTWIMYKLGGFGKFYTDQITSVTDKDSKIEMASNLIVNDDEMAVTNKLSFEDLKAFVSSTSITYRKPYATTSITKGKGFLLVRSTNNIEYLKDKTGNRRFMPIIVSKDRRTKNVADMSESDVQQIIGEATHMFGNNDGLVEDQTLSLEELSQAQASSQYISLEEEMLLTYLSANPQIKFITTQSLLENALNISNVGGNSGIGRKISYYMKNMDGWEYVRTRINGVITRGYKKL